VLQKNIINDIPLRNSLMGYQTKEEEEILMEKIEKIRGLRW